MTQSTSSMLFVFCACAFSVLFSIYFFTSIISFTESRTSQLNREAFKEQKGAKVHGNVLPNARFPGVLFHILMLSSGGCLAGPWVIVIYYSGFFFLYKRYIYIENFKPPLPPIPLSSGDSYQLRTSPHHLCRSVPSVHQYQLSCSQRFHQTM